MSRALSCAPSCAVRPSHVLARRPAAPLPLVCTVCSQRPATNNQSEYCGLLGGLRAAQSYGIKRLLVQVNVRLPRLSGLLSILIYM